MNNYLLTGDWHLTDVVLEAYRWDIFKTVTDIALRHGVTRIAICGDGLDRKDRHSKELVNAFTDYLEKLIRDTGAPVDILAGNHDLPVAGIPYWTFLNKIANIRYITKPIIDNGVFLLPFSYNPLEEWRSLSLASAKMILMHQTVAGSLIENDRKIEKDSNPMPILPRGVPIYSGDIHRPQTVGGIEYIGVPHPVKFSETWPNRVLIVTEASGYKFADVWLDSTKRAILDVTNTDELQRVNFNAGDQVRVRYKLSSQRMTTWPEEEKRIRDWALDNGVELASVEAVFVEDITVGEGSSAILPSSPELMQPEDVIRVFCEEELLGQEIYECGLDILKSVQG
jgi:DNA repair exonuclease SbcCD nuclease subunit